MKVLESLETLNEKQQFEFKSMKETREQFEYNGFELKLVYHNDDVKIPFNVDFTTGEDLIQESHKEKMKSIFSDEEYSILSYPIEQILTDKFYRVL